MNYIDDAIQYESRTREVIQSPHEPASERYQDDEQPAAFSPTELIRTFVAYKNAILLSTAGLIAAIILMIALVSLVAPSQRMMSLPFVLTFRGAEEGRYPNGTPFEKSDIVSGTVLAEVYKSNDLGKFMTFDNFKRSVVVLESNTDLENLKREYEAKLSDPKLNPIDRDRLEREYQDKRSALSKSDYSLEMMYGGRIKQVPRALADKVLQDVLNTWSTRAVRERGVASFDVSTLTENILDASALQANDLLIAADITRVNIDRIISNVDNLLDLPSAKLVRTPQPENLSLPEIRYRLDDLRRFRLQPIIAEVLDRGTVGDRTAAIRYIETQLRVSEIARDAARAREDKLRAALGVYSDSNDRDATISTAATGDLAPVQRQDGGVSPQLSESFLDELLRMSQMNEDVPFRQELVKQMRDEGLTAVPLQNEANYYDRILKQLRTGTAGSAGDLTAVSARLRAVVATATKATHHINDLYKRLSAELNPSGMMVQMPEPTTARVERSIGLKDLAIISALLFIVGFILIIVGCVAHAAVQRTMARRGEPAENDEPAIESTPHPAPRIQAP
ncbi:MAG TPA: hypothetical protein VEK57_21815 [Thermoanaerobaculia bacterium]|nr:hypothetical protein [Thermoanaerobaculia bacterium]